MRLIYLIRHGRPDFPDGKTLCLGNADVPLGSLGRLQSALLGVFFANKGLTQVFCSNLSRSRETARLMGFESAALPGLEELAAGEWDGLSFDEIRARWPALFARRGTDPSVSPPGGETRERGLLRFSAAFDRAARSGGGDIAVVAHASVSRLFLCSLAGKPLDRWREIFLPYGSYTEIFDGAGGYTPGRTGVVPHPALDEAACLRLLAAADTPVTIVKHGLAVAKEAMRLVCALAAAGSVLDAEAIYAAAMLHDIARREPDHAAAGAALLEGLGYPKEAALVRVHHDLPCPERADEAAVLFLADKLVLEDGPVTLRARFAASGEKCRDDAARAAHERRYAAALRAARTINDQCGKEVIQ